MQRDVFQTGKVTEFLEFSEEGSLIYFNGDKWIPRLRCNY